MYIHTATGSISLPTPACLAGSLPGLGRSPHSEAADSIRGQLAEQLHKASAGLHVTRDKGVLPELDGYTPEPDVLVVDSGVLGPGDAFIDQKHVYFVAESVSRSTVGNDYGRKLNQYAARGIATYLIVDVLTGECVLYQAPKGDEYTSAVPYQFGETVEFAINGIPVSVRTDFRKIA